ncbi:MAG: hypothetical protein RR034_04450 [Bacteroidales bacterium]
MKKFLMALICLTSMGFWVSCDKPTVENPINPEDPTNDETYNWYAVKKGTIVYQVSDVQITYTFDEYGKIERLDYGTIVYIKNAISKKYIMLSPEEQAYQVLENDYQAEMPTFLFMGEEIGWGGLSVYGAVQTTQNIAGKACKVWNWSISGESYRYGGWKRLIFVNQWNSYEDGGMLAVSFAETVPAGSFDIPDHYTELNY